MGETRRSQDSGAQENPSGGPTGQGSTPRRSRHGSSRLALPSAPEPGRAATADQRSQVGAELGNKSVAEFLADLVATRRGERAGASLLAEVREELAALILRAQAEGIGYDRMAQATLRAVRGTTVTVAQRNREAARLRKLVHRHRVTTRHGYPLAAPGTSPRSDSPSKLMKGDESMTQKLISRKTIEERFVDTDEDERLDDIDNLESEDEREEDEHEPSRAARPRR